MRLVSVWVYVLVFVFMSINVQAQFSQQDSIRGGITTERAWWDLTHYHLSVEIDPSQKSIEGQNIITYQVLSPHQTMQIDLQSPLTISSVIQDGDTLNFTKNGDAWYIQLQKSQNVGETHSLTVRYGGKPHVANNAPWDGGVVWKKDKNGLDFMATACQGIGASIWWPCKDHVYDEPDSMAISLTVPSHLVGVSNGRLRKVTVNTNNTKTFDWAVTSPINNYGVNASVADYVHFGEVYQGVKGPLDCDYYVLRENLEKAQNQFTQVANMLEAFEYWFGPYPFYEDSYKLIEVPYLGMEHQSCVTYGNRYENGYLGNDLSGSGWGLTFDFIIIHESGHEWFGNSVTEKDVADMWIHEGFTCYSESLFVEYFNNKNAGAEYVRGLRKNIVNDKPMIGHYGVNDEGSSDIYYKGANLLHTLRQIIRNDDLWLDILRGIQSTFYHQNVDTKQIENYISNRSGIDFSYVFDQYLRTKDIPMLEYGFKDNFLYYRWTNCIKDFRMPIDITIGQQPVRLKATSRWNKIKPTLVNGNDNITLSDDYYIKARKVNIKTNIFGHPK